MRVTISPSRARGTAAAPPSKSMAHRLLICAGLAEGVSRVRGVSYSQDVCATIDCLRALGATVEIDGDTVTVSGTSPVLRKTAVTLPCRECGSTLRFFVPICMLSSASARLTGSETLLSRPLTVYQTLAERFGLPFAVNGTELSLSGPLPAGKYEIQGDISSQFISGLLFALPLSDGDSTLRLLPPVESRPYVDMTVSALRRFGIVAERAEEYLFRISGKQTYLPCDVTVEGDYSNAAFLFALNLTGGDVTVTGLAEDSLQGDRVCVDAMERLSGGFCTVDLADCPDLGPVLFVAAALSQGGRFTGVKRLRWKESDRVGAMAEELEKCGVSVCEEADSVTVLPRSLKTPSVPLLGHNDHRIVMALSVLLTRLGGTLEGAEAVRKSDPAFFDRIRSLGVQVKEDGMDS